MSQASVDADGDGSGAAVVSGYTYDADGIRVSQTVGSVETQYLNDKQNPTGYSQVLEEKNGSGNVTTYTLGLAIIAQQSPTVASGETLYLLKDGHDSTTALVNSSGQIIAGQVFAYDAFGERLDTAAALTTHLYCGEDCDSTGLIYLRQRYYRPETGTFTTLDSSAGNNSDPQSLHKYLFTPDDPINFADPTGWSFFAFDGTGMWQGSMDQGQWAPSNIYKMYLASTEPESHKHYYSGPGSD